jgi:outer membrane protein TolC
MRTLNTEHTMSRLLRAQVLIGVLATMAGLPAGVVAQEAETLAALIAEARANNPEIEATRRQAAAAAARVPQAGALPDPMVAHVRRMADFGRELSGLERAVGIELTEVAR